MVRSLRPQRPWLPRLRTVRLAFPVTVIVPILVLSAPILDLPGDKLLWVDLVCALVAAGMLIGAQLQNSRTVTWWCAAGVLTVWLVTVAVTVALAAQGTSRLPLVTTWTLAACAGLLLSRTGAWPQDRVGFTLTAVITAVVLGSSLIDGWEAARWMFPWLALMTGGALLVGVTIRSHGLRLREQRIEVRDRERRAIAGELHDVIAHEISGVVVLAQAVRAVTVDPVAVQALERIETAGQRALRDIRVLVAAWREDASSRPSTTPPAELQTIDRIVEDFRAMSRADVTLTRRGDPEVSAAVAGAAVRIVSEALTNIRRHAGTAATVAVDIDCTPKEVVISVVDDGVGGGIGGGGGSGLAGIAERADLLGGSATCGPTGEGGWRVDARLPRRAR